MFNILNKAMEIKWGRDVEMREILTGNARGMEDFSLFHRAFRFTKFYLYQRMLTPPHSTHHRRTKHMLPHDNNADF